MKESALSRFAERYGRGLLAHLAGDPAFGMQTANELGDEAVIIGLETLDLARIHEVALAALMPPDGAAATLEDMTARAAFFFTEAITSIEKTHPVALEVDVDLKLLIEKLERRTQALENSNRDLRAKVIERQQAEVVLKTSEKVSLEVLDESRHLEMQLQDMARKILSSNEEERKKMSHLLQDEVAQSLLGIQMRLLALKNKSAASHAGVTEEIANIRRLVETSATTISRLTRGIGIHHE